MQPDQTAAERRRLLWPGLLAVVAGAAVVLGVVLRLWLLLHHPLTSDEAIVGLMAGRIRHGQMYTFFWGQPYGGVEPYVAAAWTTVAGSSGVALNALPSLLWALTALLVWRVAVRALPGRPAALAVGAAVAVWVWPDAAVYNSTRELGFRGVAALLGVGLLLAALRVVERRSARDMVVLGVVAGLGWWASPEIVYFAVPSAVILAGSRRSGAIAWPLWLGGLAAAAVGALPWLVTNVRTRFLSLRSSSSPDYVHSTYVGRLSVFAHKTFPMMLGLINPVNGRWVAGHAGQAACAAATVVLVASCVWSVGGWGMGDRRGVARAVGIGVAAFPFIFAVFPATSFWEQGQYGVYLVPLMALMMVAPVDVTVEDRTPTAGTHSRRNRGDPGAGPAKAAILGLVAAGLISAASFEGLWLGHYPRSFVKGWGDPDATIAASIRSLESQGIRSAYAQYWVAYDLDYLSGNRLEVTDPYSDRWVAEYYLVRSSPDPAWLFYGPGAPARAGAAFSSPVAGPYGYSEAQFTSKLTGLGVGYRVVRAGVLDAVVPARAVTQEQVGIPPPYWK